MELNEIRKKMSRYAKLNDVTNSYVISGFLVAQLGKNYGVDGGCRITGKLLMQLVDQELADLQHRAGGGIKYLDCEEDNPLSSFYENEGYSYFGERISEKDGKKYLQYMKFF